MADVSYQSQENGIEGEDVQHAKRQLSESTAAVRQVARDRLRDKYEEMRVLSQLAKLSAGDISRLHILEAGVAHLKLQERIILRLKMSLCQAGVELPVLPSNVGREAQIFSPGGPQLRAMRRKRGGRGAPLLEQKIQLEPPGQNVQQIPAGDSGRQPIQMADIYGSYRDRHPESHQGAQSWGGAGGGGVGRDPSDRGGQTHQREGCSAAQGRADGQEPGPVIEVLGGKQLLPFTLQNGCQPNKLKIISVRSGIQQDLCHNWNQDQHPDSRHRADEWGGVSGRKNHLPTAPGLIVDNSDEVKVVWQGMRDLSSSQQPQRSDCREPISTTYKRSRGWTPGSDLDVRSPWERRVDKIQIYSSTLERLAVQRPTAMSTPVTQTSPLAGTMNLVSNQEMGPLDLSVTRNRNNNGVAIKKPAIWSPAREMTAQTRSTGSEEGEIPVHIVRTAQTRSTGPEEGEIPGHIVRRPVPTRLVNWMNPLEPDVAVMIDVETVPEIINPEYPSMVTKDREVAQALLDLSINMVEQTGWEINVIREQGDADKVVADTGVTSAGAPGYPALGEEAGLSSGNATEEAAEVTRVVSTKHTDPTLGGEVRTMPEEVTDEVVEETGLLADTADIKEENVDEGKIDIEEFDITTSSSPQPQSSPSQHSSPGSPGYPAGWIDVLPDRRIRGEGNLLAELFGAHTDEEKENNPDEEEEEIIPEPEKSIKPSYVSLTKLNLRNTSKPGQTTNKRRKLRRLKTRENLLEDCEGSEEEDIDWFPPSTRKTQKSTGIKLTRRRQETRDIGGKDWYGTNVYTQSQYLNFYHQLQQARSGAVERKETGPVMTAGKEDACRSPDLVNSSEVKAGKSGSPVLSLIPTATEGGHTNWPAAQLWDLASPNSHQVNEEEEEGEVGNSHFDCQEVANNFNQIAIMDRGNTDYQDIEKLDPIASGTKESEEGQLGKDPESQAKSEEREQGDDPGWTQGLGTRGFHQGFENGGETCRPTTLEVGSQPAYHQVRGEGRQEVGQAVQLPPSPEEPPAAPGQFICRSCHKPRSTQEGTDSPTGVRAQSPEPGERKSKKAEDRLGQTFLV